jgi:hypothetical protein
MRSFAAVPLGCAVLGFIGRLNLAAVCWRGEPRANDAELRSVSVNRGAACRRVSANEVGEVPVLSGVGLHGCREFFAGELAGFFGHRFEPLSGGMIAARIQHTKLS